MFRRKKKKDEEEEIRKKRIKKVLEEVKPKLEMPQKRTSSLYYTEEELVPEEYYRFLREIKKVPETFYEKLCWNAKKIIKIKLSPDSREKILNAIETAYMNATPEGVVALSFLVLIFGLILSTLYLFLFQDIAGTLFLTLFFLGVSYYCYTYPQRKSREIEVKMASDLVLAVLYMVVYMRSSPNFEGAIKFAAENLTGPLSWDLKKLLWDIELGKYSSMKAALGAYMAKWKDKNEEFVEALELLKTSTLEPPGRRYALMDEAVNVILDGTKLRMKIYARQLKMPVMIIHALGIMLPVIGLVMFPIFALFMADLLKPVVIFVGYDILLPAFLLWYMSEVLRTRPATFSQPDVSKIKELPPLGKFRVFGKDLPILPFAVLASLPFFFIGFSGIASTGINTVNDILKQVAFSVAITFGIAVFFITYGFLDSLQKFRLRKEIEKIEEELGEALYAFGNRIATGIPLERAIDEAVKDMKTLKISELFKRVSALIKRLNFTIEQALFDKEAGVIHHYHSKLIKSVFTVVIESAEKSIELAALTCLTISRYLKGIKAVKEELYALLSETISSMHFLAVFLAPLISGIVVTMAIIIMQIIFTLSSKLSQIMTTSPTTGMPTILLWSWSGGGKGNMPITPAGFQLVVGIYTVEVAVLLAYFINRLKYGDDAVGFRNVLYKTVFMSTIVYLLAWWVTFSVFAPMIWNFISPV